MFSKTFFSIGLIFTLVIGLPSGAHTAPSDLSADSMTGASQTVSTTTLPASLQQAILNATAQPLALTASEQKVIASGAAGDRFGLPLALSGDTALVGSYMDNIGANSAQGSVYVFTRSGRTWDLQQQLIASDGAAMDGFGFSVALSGDTALIGSILDDINANNDQGSAYIFTRSGTTWSQQAKLTSSDGAAEDHYGRWVALEGNTALVGAPLDDIGANADQGSAYVFTGSGSAWSQQSKLTAPDGAAGNNFGATMTLAGTTALVGAFPINNPTTPGSAYVFMGSGAAWSQQAKLTASNGAVGDAFSASVALSGDTALIGAPGDDIGANTDQGSAYFFTRSGSTWSQQTQLTASDGAAEDLFGYSVALSGDTALVGAWGDTIGGNAYQGSAYVFTRSGTTWSQQTKLTASDSATGDWFGYPVALSGDTVLAGACGDDIGANVDQGSAYIFTRSGSAWSQQAQLTGSNGEAGDKFGNSAAISGDTAIVGARLVDVGTNENQGSAFIFIRSGSAWILQEQLFASDGAAGDMFGISVALSGDTVLVGALSDDVGTNADQGSVYVFTRSGSAWSQRAKLTASDGAADDRLGVSVALSGDTALVGAFTYDVGTNADQGSVYVFTRSGTAWSQQAKLVASDGAAGDAFGASVALSSDTALVGAYLDDIATDTDQGSAYVFTRSGTGWSQQTKLIASDGAAGDQFGSSAALTGDAALVGASEDDIGANANQGSAYVFARSGTAWSQQAYLIASDGAAGDEFGAALALSGDMALVGAYQDDIGTNADQGSTYVFTHSGTDWSQQGMLTASDGTAGDAFGAAVAFSGDMALVGAYLDDVGGNVDQGSAYFFHIQFLTQDFADVPEEYWAFSWIERLYRAGITSGCSLSPLLYCPEDSVTRAQMAKFLEKGIHGSAYTPPAGTGTVFVDVPLSYWAVDWIEKLYADGITSGCLTSPLSYCPNQTVTRDQMAKFLLVAKHGAGYTPPAVGDSTGFGDVSTSYWAAPWIQQLASEGITSGCGGGNYCPDDSVTRAQMAKFLVLTFNLP